MNWKEKRKKKITHTFIHTCTHPRLETLLPFVCRHSPWSSSCLSPLHPPLPLLWWRGGAGTYSSPPSSNTTPPPFTNPLLLLTAALFPLLFSWNTVVNTFTSSSSSSSSSRLCSNQCAHEQRWNQSQQLLSLSFSLPLLSYHRTPSMCSLFSPPCPADSRLSLQLQISPHHLLSPVSILSVCIVLVLVLFLLLLLLLLSSRATTAPDWCWIIQQSEEEEGKTGVGGVKRRMDGRAKEWNHGWMDRYR